MRPDPPALDQVTGTKVSPQHAVIDFLAAPCRHGAGGDHLEKELLRHLPRDLFGEVLGEHFHFLVTGAGGEGNYRDQG